MIFHILKIITSIPQKHLTRVRALRVRAVECSRLLGLTLSLAVDGIAMTTGRVAYAARGACVWIGVPAKVVYLAG